MICKNCIRLADHLAAAESALDAGSAYAVEMREVLSDLVDYQNDAPLEKYRVQWTAAMARARAALAKNPDDALTGHMQTCDGEIVNDVCVKCGATRNSSYKDTKS